MDDDNWPKHPDGRNKKLGELPKEQQMEIVRRAAEKVAAEFQRPEVQAGLAAVLDADPRCPH